MSLKDIIEVLVPAVEAELKRQIGRLDQPSTNAFHEMLTYHMGKNGERPENMLTGKRIRPLLLLLVTAASGHDWADALPAAAAVEMVHNFSLIHDDIEDNSAQRHGRPPSYLWKKFSTPMAINAGDALFALSSMAICDLARSYSGDIAIRPQQFFTLHVSLSHKASSWIFLIRR